MSNVGLFIAIDNVIFDAFIYCSSSKLHIEQYSVDFSRIGKPLFYVWRVNNQSLTPFFIC
ncbi:hypothetical protein CAter282_1077 [Collimonas arenae]|uniref:Uncharacterized protein n=1 Tax=Collimonas arenae TaxID=279058 RepID=A0A127QGZ4_9BURK|nr:hypothetical protein CAter282_1077 [Collimonas arenae]